MQELIQQSASTSRKKGAFDSSPNQGPAQKPPHLWSARTGGTQPGVASGPRRCLWGLCSPTPGPPPELGFRPGRCPWVPAAPPSAPEAWSIHTGPWKLHPHRPPPSLLCFRLVSQLSIPSRESARELEAPGRGYQLWRNLESRPGFYRRLWPG